MKKEIKPELYQKLVKLNDKKIALDAFMKSMMSEGQRVMAEYNDETRNVWMEIVKETGVDLRNSDWAPDGTTPNTIVCIQQRFFPGQ